MNKNFIGIDLGTTNSAMVSYNGVETRIWKSPEQNDVTPSAIYQDKRGRKYVGKKAYDTAPQNPDNAAMLFKRLMGSDTPIKFAGESRKPEECSAEILKTLFGYLPEEIRNDPETATVITVPAAFNQMQKDATLEAAQLAQLGKVALMQEPVAAVMSVMNAKSSKDGTFLIYDIGGGTLDIAIAESIGGRVNLLQQGGLQLCGGRDFDRDIFEGIIKPWLLDNFDLPEDFEKDPQFSKLARMAIWAGERAKIELSSGLSARISLSEEETRCSDLNGEDIYIDTELTREIYNPLIEERIDESIEATREIIAKAGLKNSDIDKIVFIGGPSHYAPMREKVSNALEIPASVDVNPMTAVAEGAAIFAESIDWSSKSRGRKSSRGSISSDGKLPVSFNFTARTPDSKAKIVVKLSAEVDSGSEFEIKSLDTGWISGRLPLKQNESITVPLDKKGDNHFSIAIFDSAGGEISFAQNKIVITKAAATIDAIPASHSISVEVQESFGSKHTTLEYLIKAGDSLPKKATKIFKAAETLKAGSDNSLNFKLWEGEIKYPVEDNRCIGTFKLKGSDFDDGVIPAGADLEVSYEMNDSGNIYLKVSVPAIAATFAKNFYSRQEGQMDFSKAQNEVKNEARRTIERIAVMEEKIDDPKLDEARNKLEQAMEINNSDDTEKVQEALEKVYEARKLASQVREEKIYEVLQSELDALIRDFDRNYRSEANQNDINSFENLSHTTQKVINDKIASQAENLLEELREKLNAIKYNSPRTHIEFFHALCQDPSIFDDTRLFNNHRQQGQEFIRNRDYDSLKSTIAAMIRNSSQLQEMFSNSSNIDADDSAMIAAAVNILRG